MPTLQVTLTAEGASRMMQTQLASKAYTEITEMLQKAADKVITPSPPLTIGGFQILMSNDIRFSCDTEEEANHLHKIDWTKAIERLEVRQPKFSIVIHSIPIEEIYPHIDNLVSITDEIGNWNNLKIVKLRIL